MEGDGVSSTLGLSEEVGVDVPVTDDELLGLSVAVGQCDGIGVFVFEGDSEPVCVTLGELVGELDTELVTLAVLL